MIRPHVPQSILDAAHARKTARLAQDWAEADRLKAEIEAGGWRVVDRGADFRLGPARPPDIDDGWRVRYGASDAVPSRLVAPATAPVSAVLLTPGPGATDEAGTLEGRVATLRAAAPGLPMVIVAGDPPEGHVEAVRDLCESAGDVEVVWTNGRFRPGAAANAGLRRASGEVIVVLAPGVALEAEALDALIATLADPRILLAGTGGLEGDDPGQLRPSAPGPARALDGSCLAIRHDDALRFELDEHYLTWRGAAIAWALSIGGSAVAGGAPPVLALDLSLVVTEAREAGADPEPARAARRDRYRLSADFGPDRPPTETIPGS